MASTGLTIPVGRKYPEVYRVAGMDVTQEMEKWVV